MHKYPSSLYVKLRIFIYTLSIICDTCFFTYAIIYELIKGFSVFEGLFVLLVAMFAGVITIGGTREVLSYLDDPFFGHFTLYYDKIVFNTLKGKEYIFRYDACADIGVVEWINRDRNSRSSAVVYFSKTQLPDDTKHRLIEAVASVNLSRNYKQKMGLTQYKSDYILFEYREEVFNDLLNCVPEWAQKSLLESKEKAMKEIDKFENWEVNFWSRDARKDIKK